MPRGAPLVQCLVMTEAEDGQVIDILAFAGKEVAVKRNRVELVQIEPLDVFHRIHGKVWHVDGMRRKLLIAKSGVHARHGQQVSDVDVFVPSVEDLWTELVGGDLCPDVEDSWLGRHGYSLMTRSVLQDLEQAIL